MYTHLDAKNRSIQAMDNVPSIHNTVHAANKHQRTTRWAPHATRQLDSVLLRPYYGIIATILRPYFRLPIANAYIVFDKQRIPFDRIHWSCVSYRQGLDLICWCFVLPAAAVDQPILCPNRVLVWHRLLEFHCTNAKASFRVNVLSILGCKIQEVVRLVQISHIPPKNPTVRRTGQKLIGRLRPRPQNLCDNILVARFT